MALKGSKTEGNLKAAFAGESQANRRYLYFAAKADVEGYNDVAAVFRSTAEGETGHAHGHLDYLKESGELPLDKSLKEFERGVKLSRECQGALKDAEQRVQVLMDGELKDFPAGGRDDDGDPGEDPDEGPDDDQP